jgi:hypothetical protein
MMRQRSKWLLLFLALVPGCLSSSCGADCSGDGDPDCSALTAASAVATPTANPGALTLACASSAGSNAELEWELTVGGGGAPYAYTIDFGDGTSATAGTWPASGVHRGVHGYGRPGDFQFTAQVRDAGGRTQACGMVATAPVPGLELSCAATPRTGEAPLRVTFDAPPGGRRGCVGPCTVSWSFGDGSEAEGGRAEHEYQPAATAGSRTYDAVATLQDGRDRQARCRVPIEVRSTGAATPPTPTPNRPPVIDAFDASPASISAGQSSALGGSLSDPDPGDTTTWSLSSSAGNLSPSTGSGPIVSTFTAPAGFSGSVTITATAADNHGAVSHRSVTVSVTAPPNHAPVITSLVAIPSLILGPGGGHSNIQGSMSDPDGPITWTFDVSGGGILGPTSGSGTTAAASLSIPPSPIGGIGGASVIRLTARDPGGLTATRTVVVTVIVDVGLTSPAVGFDSGRERVP